MPLFYPRPQPFIGGRQPLAPRQTPPTISTPAAVDLSPLFGLMRRRMMHAVLASWQPGAVTPLWQTILVPEAASAPPTTIAARRGLNALGTRAGSRSHMGD